ncbi:MAG TPA: dethiobiotin synthase [Cyclobacteriaceae bacterium]
MNYFVTGIDTDSGKTFASAILCEALQADYWKPIQAGTPRDADTVTSLVSYKNFKTHHEAYLLNTPASPHAAAKIDNINISLSNFKIPESDNIIIIEGAGGCLVPINDHDFVIDIISHLKTEVILIADLYLGSINHTLLTIEALRNRNLPIKGIIFNGESNPESEGIILLHSKLKCLLRIAKENTIDKHTVTKYANQLKESWNE